MLLRGIRNASDFAYEVELAYWNKRLCAGIETLFVPADHACAFVRSSAIKELAEFGGDYSDMVPPLVAAAVKQKYGGVPSP